MTTTVVTRVKDRAARTPDQIALRAKDFGIWQEVSWAQYWANVELVGDALLALGLQPGDRVAIHSENRREWLYADLGVVAARGITVGLYPTNPASEVAYLLSHSGARILIAEDQEQVDKALAVLEDTPDLERIVYLEPRGVKGRYDNPKFSGWGRAATDAKGVYRFRTVKPGAPKGRIPHVNFLILYSGLMRQLQTVMFFELAPDPVLDAVPEKRRPLLVAHREGTVYRFDLRLRGKGETPFFDD